MSATSELHHDMTTTSAYTALLDIHNEVDCRIEHGAESGGHLEAIRAMLHEAMVSSAKSILGGPDPQWTASEFHALVTDGATAAWQNSGLPLRHVEIYSLVECAFRTAFPDRVPSNEGV